MLALYSMLLGTYCIMFKFCQHNPGAGPEFWRGGGVHFIENVEDQKRSTMKLKYIIIIPIYSFTDKLHCDCFIRVTDRLLY